MTGRRAPEARPVPEPLTYNVASLLAESPGATRDYLVSGLTLDLGDDVRQSDPLEGHVHLARTNRGLLVSGQFATTLEGQCSRCLREIEVPIEVRIDEEALPSLDLESGTPVDTSAEPDVVRLTDHHELELGPVVRDAILLAEPIAPLCRPDCPGLCPVCGERLTGKPHDHGEEEIDPRLEALKAFRVDGGDDTG